MGSTTSAVSDTFKGYGVCTVLISEALPSSTPYGLRITAHMYGYLSPVSRTYGVLVAVIRTYCHSLLCMYSVQSTSTTSTEYYYVLRATSTWYYYSVLSLGTIEGYSPSGQ